MTTVYTWSSSADTDPETFIGAAPTIDASGGSYGERYLWPATTAQAYMRKNVTALGNHAIRFIYSLASGATSSHEICQGNDGTTSIQWRVDLSAGGLIRIRNATAQVAQGTVALAYGVEHRFEVIRNGSTLTVKAYRVSDNSLRDTVTGTVGNVALSYVFFGNNAPLTGTLGAFSFDEIVITDTTAEVGPVASALSATATVSPNPVAQGAVLTLTITATGGSGTYLYSVTNWGDGSSSPAQSSPVFTKTIPGGTYLGSKTVSWSVTD